MKIINLNKLNKEIHFPTIRAVPINLDISIFMRFLSFFLFRRTWEVMRDYHLWVPSLCMWIFVPKGFIYDAASIPKILSNIFRSTGILLFGSLPHDFGYRYEGLFLIDYKGCLSFKSYTKEELDKIFLHLSCYESGMAKACKVATFTLSCLGFMGWNSNRKRNCNLQDDFPEIFINEPIKED